MADLTGTTIDGRFRVVKKLGAGGMGEVWLAHQQSLGRDVALKVIKAKDDDAEHLARFQREARAVSKVRHDNVVVVFDTGVDANTGLAFIAMEHLEGRTLKARMSEGALPVAEAVNVARQIAAALAAAHAVGLVHRDVKPENVILVDKPAGRVKLLDFGIARATNAGDTLTATGMFVGTPAYAAPEVVLGKTSADPKSDLYAAGAVLFEMLSGKRVFEGSTGLAVALRHAQEPAPRLDSAPPWLADLVARLLDKDPAHRPTAASLVRRLDEREAGPTTGARPVVSVAAPVSAATHASDDAATQTATMVKPAAPLTPGPRAPVPHAAQGAHAYENPWLTIDVDPARHIVRITRNSKRIELVDVDAALSCIGVEPRGVDLSKYGVLVDMRAPAGRNDGFEAASASHFARLRVFRRTATLSKSAVGKLHLGRLTAEALQKTTFISTDDEAEALAFLLQAGP